MKVSRFAKASVGFFFSLFLLLMLAGVWAKSEMAMPVLAGMTWGHVLFLLIHLLAVLAAWIYIAQGTSDGESAP